MENRKQKCEGEQAKYKEWLENEGKEEGIKIKVHLINDYTGWADPNPAWVFKISRRVGTIKIPKDIFSKKPKFTERERRAIGLHELGHLMALKNSGYLGVLRQQGKNKKWVESEADAYVKKRRFGESLASSLKKGRELREKFRKKSWWRIKIWWRKRTWSDRYPNNRIKKLLDCPQKAH